MTKDEALKLALEALEVATTPLAKDRQEVLRARAAIREALAQPDQEPVAWAESYEDGDIAWHKELCFSDDPEWLDNPIPLYTTPPQRKPLDEREREWIVATCPTPRHIIKAVEAAHGIKEEA